MSELQNSGGEVNVMSETEKRIQEKLEKAIPQMNDRQKSYLLGYGEAVLDMHQDREEEECRTNKEG